MERWTLPAGWKIVNITLENMTHYLPRMGYLFSDGLFDLAKVNQNTEPACSTLIGRGMSRLVSHWSRVMLAPALLCHKEPARRIQSPRLGAGSLWHKGACNRTFPCMEATYPYAIKNQRGASKIPPYGYFAFQSP